MELKMNRIALIMVLCCIVASPLHAAPAHSLEMLLVRAKFVFIAEAAEFDGETVALKVKKSLRGKLDGADQRFKANTIWGKPKKREKYFVISQGHDRHGEAKNEIKLSQGIDGQSSYCGWIMLPIRNVDGVEKVHNAHTFKARMLEGYVSPVPLNEAKHLVTQGTAARAVEVLLDRWSPIEDCKQARQVLWDLDAARQRTVLPRLIKGLYVGDGVQVEVAQALMGLGTPPVEVVPELIRLLKTKHHRYALQALHDLGPDAQSAVPAVVEFIERDKPNDYMAIFTLAAIGPSPRVALPVLNRVAKKYPERAAHAEHLSQKIRFATELKLSEQKVLDGDTLRQITDKMLRGTTAERDISMQIATGWLSRIAKEDQPQAIHDVLQTIGELRQDFNKKRFDWHASFNSRVTVTGLNRVENIVPALIECLDDEATRLDAMFFLRAKQAEAVAAIPRLIRIFDEESRWKYSESLYGTLVDIAPKHPDVVKVLSRFAAKEITVQDHSPVAALTALLKSEEAAVESLVSHLDTTYSLGSFAPAPRELVKVLVRIGEPAVPHLQQALSSDDPIVRTRAAFTLGEIGPPAIRTAIDLRNHLNDEDSKVRFAVAIALARIGSKAKAAVLALIERLEKWPAPDVVYREREIEQIERAVVALGRIGPEARSALSLLEKTLSHPEANSMRPQIVLARWRIDGDTDQAIASLISIRGIVALGEMGSAARPATEKLIAFAKEDSNYNAYNAIEALWRIHGNDPKMIDPLIDFLGGPGQRRALQWLGEFGPTAARAWPALEKLLDESKDYRERRVIYAALQKIKS